MMRNEIHRSPGRSQRAGPATQAGLGAGAQCLVGWYCRYEPSRTGPVYTTLGGIMDRCK
jgi:hypothetical protein